MKAAEKNYAVQRVLEIERRKAQAVRDKYPDADKCLSNRDKVAMIKSGKAKIKKDVDYGGYRIDLDSIFVWPEDSKKVKAEKQLAEEIDKLDAQAQQVKDELMLGDEEKALALLRQFERE
uniref:Uncharacterized protein n=1 Tax=viral metagenome TaxID=1070528 RepID=A0A6M3LUF9_9ZZZZ